jgi:hypothetical protein
MASPAARTVNPCHSRSGMSMLVFDSPLLVVLARGLIRLVCRGHWQRRKRDWRCSWVCRVLLVNLLRLRAGSSVAEQGTFNPRVVGEFGLSIGFSLLIFAGALAFSCHLSCQYVQQLQAKSVGPPLASLGDGSRKDFSAWSANSLEPSVSPWEHEAFLFSVGEQNEKPPESRWAATFGT